jgi:hypothetical protein
VYHMFTPKQVHVRHGDKWRESELVRDDEYMPRVLEAYERAQGKLQKKIFLSTGADR